MERRALERRLYIEKRKSREERLYRLKKRIGF